MDESSGDAGVFSAHAEVVPHRQVYDAPYVCILRARGGSSNPVMGLARFGVYSPRTRR